MSEDSRQAAAIPSPNNNVHIKSEPCDDNTPVPDSNSPPSLKRQRSSGPESAEKRQRIETATPVSEHKGESGGMGFDLEALIARATASATEGFGRENRDETPSQSQSQISNDEATNQDDAATEAGNLKLFVTDPQLGLRKLSLPILESLSTQILSTLGTGQYDETIQVVTDPDTDRGQAYKTLKGLFIHTKKIYSKKAPFLSADELNIHEPEHREIIRMTNLATFVASIFGGGDVGFYELNDHFVETFTPDGEPLAKEPGQLFLTLKTQMYISAMSSDEVERTKEDMLEDLFPDALEDLLSGRHDGPLSESEQQFLQDAKARREYLMNVGTEPEAIDRLLQEFVWDDFLRSLSAHLNAGRPLLAPYMKKHSITAPKSPVHDDYTYQTPALHVPQQFEDDEILKQAERAAQLALQSVGFGPYSTQTQNGHQSPYQQPPPPQPQNGYQSQYGPTGGTPSNIPYPTQTAPTQVLYEKARQAAVAKSNPGQSRHPNLPSQRRPWSTEEENALMAGLDQVQGPHWSQILALYGSKGSVSDILKDRNQVQLKDKARNLKLFFLKSGIEVPYYLQSVTGELKTRAPSQAARKEAEERERLMREENKAHFNATMVLGGLGNDVGNDVGKSREGTETEMDGTEGQGEGEEEAEGDEHFQVEEVMMVESPAFSKAQLHPQAEAQAQLLSDDEHLRRTLLAANALAVAKGDGNGNGNGLTS